MLDLDRPTLVLSAGMRWSQLQVEAGLLLDVPLLVRILRIGVVSGAVVGGAAMFLSFFPPARYLAWLRAGHEPTS